MPTHYFKFRYGDDSLLAAGENPWRMPLYKWQADDCTYMRLRKMYMPSFFKWMSPDWEGEEEGEEATFADVERKFGKVLEREPESPSLEMDLVQSRRMDQEIADELGQVSQASRFTIIPCP